MRRLTLLTAAALGLMLAFATSALAHVTVSAPGATRSGSDQQITFRVPVEKNVDTVGLTVALPTDTPIASVLVQPIPGWRHTEKTVKLAHPIKTDDGDITRTVAQISWRATAGHGLAPGEFGTFTIIAGQLPDAASLTFPTLQYYRDGSVVKWNQVAAPGTAEPDDPAPVLQLADAPPDAARDAKSTSDTGPYVLGAIAVALAAAALGSSLLYRTRKPA